jgi:hypothetical protein
MAHEFTEYEYEPEAEAASSHGGGPPSRLTGVGVLDPLLPPRRPSGARHSLLLRILGAVVLLGVVAGLLLLWLNR